MVRKFEWDDLDFVMQIWYDTNISAHSFIPEEYWKKNFAMVKEILPQAEVYVHEDNCTNRIDGFIGLSGDYIAGIFVRETMQSGGIGKALLDYAKTVKERLRLNVYQKNTRAVCFYEREGFVISSDDQDEDTGEKEFVMTWHKIRTVKK